MFKSFIFVIGGLLAGVGSFFLIPFIAVMLPLLAIPCLVYVGYTKLYASNENHEVLSIAQSEAIAAISDDWTDWKSIVKKPKVWIVDDDEDMAVLMQDGLKRLGIAASVITDTRDLHRKMTFDKADFILLDWMLSTELTADMVMEKAIRLINSFAELKTEFKERPPQVVTFSVLEKSKINVPASQYFEHVEHLEKSSPREDVLHRFSELIQNTMHEREVAYEKFSA